MDIHVVEARMCTNKFRIAEALVHYQGLGIYVDICLYKDEKLWVRMPEYWVTPKNKRRMTFWVNKDDSDLCQEIILNKVFDMLELNVEKALEERKRFFNQKKKFTQEENNITL